MLIFLMYAHVVTPKKLVPHWEDELFTLSRWIIKVLMSAKSHIGSVLLRLSLISDSKEL